MSSSCKNIKISKNSNKCPMQGDSFHLFVPKKPIIEKHKYGAIM